MTEAEFRTYGYIGALGAVACAIGAAIVRDWWQARKGRGKPGVRAYK